MMKSKINLEKDVFDEGERVLSSQVWERNLNIRDWFICFCHLDEFEEFFFFNKNFVWFNFLYQNLLDEIYESSHVISYPDYLNQMK